MIFFSRMLTSYKLVCAWLPLVFKSWNTLWHNFNITTAEASGTMVCFLYTLPQQIWKQLVRIKGSFNSMTTLAFTSWGCMFTVENFLATASLVTYSSLISSIPAHPLHRTEKRRMLHLTDRWFLTSHHQSPSTTPPCRVNFLSTEFYSSDKVP
jgi:hypothetical protein